MESLAVTGPRLSIFVWLLAGFSVFFVLEQYLQWHHHYLPPHHHQHYHPKRPVTYMILLADGLHNLLGGLAVGGSFLVSTEAGLITAVAAAAHEIPQELGDFGILLHGGWRKRKALLYNFISALTIIPGGLLAVAAAGTLDTVYLLPFAAGNFIYIATADLIPEIKHETDPRRSSLYFLAFALGIALLLAVKVALGG
jgi:zinc and cadmium transporter